jgi:DNA-binding MarR family transcriptional regulator
VTGASRRIDAVRVLARLNRVLETVDSGLTLPQYRVLMALSHGGVRSAMLAERLAVRRPTLTAVADGLVAAGYAVRESEPGDRRVVRLHVTEAGRAALRRADEAYLAKIEHLFDLGRGHLVEELVAVGAEMDDRMRRRIVAATPGGEPDIGSSATIPAASSIPAPSSDDPASTGQPPPVRPSDPARVASEATA